MKAASGAQRAVKKLKVSCLGLLHCASVQVPLAHGVELLAITVIRWMDKVVVAGLCFGGDQIGVHSDLFRLGELHLGSRLFFAIRGGGSAVAAGFGPWGLDLREEDPIQRLVGLFLRSWDLPQGRS